MAGSGKIFSILFFLLLTTTACGQQNKEIYRDSWKEDVLVGQECGLSGLTCCFDREKKCDSDLTCCVDPSDSSKGYCGDSCSFGGVDNFCRKEEPRCDDSAVCADGYCLACGVTGNPCCAANKCSDEAKRDDSHAECINDKCVLCGNSGELSCLSDYKCSVGNLDNGGVCHKCGGVNQPCCVGENVCKQDLRCQLGFCS